MIKLLNGHSLTEKARFQPESQSLTLNQRQSTARVVIGPSVPEIIVGDWLQDMDEPGKGIVWRVKSIDNQVETKTRTLVLEHIINTLRGKLMFGKVTPKTITGNNSATTCTAEQAVEYILGQQSDWILGSFGYGGVSNPYNFSGEDLLSALNTVSGSLEGCWWTYDTTVYPFVINMTQRQSAVTVELRAMRNIQTAKITIDMSRMYTRLYPIGKNNLHIDGNYVSKNENIYGVIEKTETDQGKATKAELLMWANELINTHSEPSVTMTVGVTDLSRETGESLDHIVLGAMCRMPLKGYGTVIEEIITQINYPDKIREPDAATATLANIQEDVASIINNLIKSGGRSGRAGAENAQEDHAWFEDTTDHVAMIAEGVAGEGASTDWSRVAELLVDGNGIHQRVTQAQQDIVDAYSLIDQTTTAIRLEIGTVQSEVRSFIEQTPDMIHAEVGYAVSGLAHSVIEQTATYIRMEVSNAASAITESVIEQTSEYVQTTVSAVASGVAWSVVTQTMTNIEQQIARKSKIYVQLTDPNDGVNVLYNGDIWIKAESLKTWDQHSGSSWNSQNAKEWRSKYGDKHYVWRDGVWVLTMDTSTDVENEVVLEQTKDRLAIVGNAVDLAGQNYNSMLEVTARSIRGEVSTANSKIYSLIEQTATSIRTQIANEVDGLQSSIEQTEDHISTSVSAAKSSLYSTIMQTATNIRTEVRNAVSGLQSSIEQTAESITTSVSAAKSSIYSVIIQTSTNIEQKIAKKSKVYIQLSDPNDGTNVLYNGDIWIKAESLKTWNQHSSSTWNSQNAKEWRSKYGDKHYVWRNGAWVMTIDTSTEVENEVELQQTKDSLAIVGRAVDIAGQKYNSALEVTAKSIRGEVSTANSQVYSVINQTATNISLSVANAVSDLQSSIEITDQKITTSVSAAKSTLYSSIMQTATSVITTVMDQVSSNYSTITQTSTSIALAVNSAKSTVYSSIEIEKNRINLVVSGTGSNATIKTASIVTAINDSGSSVIISADHINLDGYVKASQLDANWLSGQIAALNLVTAKKLSLNSGGTITFAGNSTVLTESNTPDIITGLKVVASGNGYKLQALRVGNASWTDLPDSSFSRAVTSWLVGGGSGKVNVTANPQDQTKEVPVSVGGPNSISSNGTYTYKVYYENADGDDVETGASEEVTVSVHPTKSQIGASRGSRQTSEPSTDASLSGITANGWYVITISALGTSKTFKIEVDV